jgi:hypothetical protein
VLSQFSNPQVLLSSQGQETLRAAFANLPHGAALQTPFLTALKEALTSSLHDAFLVGLIIAVLGAVAALFLKEIPLQSGAAEAIESTLVQAETAAGRLTPTGSPVDLLTGSAAWERHA